MSEWISVDDRMPEDGEDVLLSYPGEVLLGQRGDGEWWDECYTVVGITHWQPLPEPPE